MNATIATTPIQARVAYISEPKPSKYGDVHYVGILFRDLSIADDDNPDSKIWKNLSSEDSSLYMAGDIVELRPRYDDKNKLHHDIFVIEQVNSPAPVPKNAVVATTTGDQLEPPSAPGQWSLKQIQAALSRPLPQSLLSTRREGGKDLTYISWHCANRILDKYAPGWAWEITKLELADKALFMVGSLSIPCSDGLIVQCASRTESLDCSSYGDPSSNAESMAFRRACARFGLGLYLYDK
ncbi:hypothetical protein [Synechococcus sp. PCC 6312]|uniref:hypothetical protein n=1 Tax=Synechococcus sp. (strain ATCC 27167 / PCC 6312) TaxID=195253 RepID=UPI00029F3A6E|nr:hypothetical protein [Synechococcus sp. PCC 6312]AFY61170.1 hypothetical protein Syn6312_2038 [Synechococcus sp. PCC 6312]